MNEPIKKTDLKDRGSNRHQSIPKGDFSKVREDVAKTERDLVALKIDQEEELKQFDKDTQEMLDNVVKAREEEKGKIREAAEKQEVEVVEQIELKKDLLKTSLKDDFDQASNRAQEIAQELFYRRVSYQGGDENNYLFLLTDLDKKRLREEEKSQG